MKLKKIDKEINGLLEGELKMVNKYKCIFCGKEKEGYGNNPFPLATLKDGKCCDNCNLNKVLPARLKQITLG